MCEWVQLGATLRAVTAAINMANTVRQAARLAPVSIGTVHTLLIPLTGAFFQFYFIPVHQQECLIATFARPPVRSLVSPLPTDQPGD